MLFKAVLVKVALERVHGILRILKLSVQTNDRQELLHRFTAEGALLFWAVFVVLKAHASLLILMFFVRVVWIGR